VKLLNAPISGEKYGAEIYEEIYMLFTFPNYRMLRGRRNVHRMFETVMERDDFVGFGMMRHASAEGCQLVIQAGEYEVGQTLRLVLADSCEIMGAVSWLLEGRVAVAFRDPLDPAMLAEITRLQGAHIPLRVCRA